MQKPLFAIVAILAISGIAHAQSWDGYGENAQHTALSAIASQPLQNVHWVTPVDLDPVYSGNGDLYTHYGSPVITSQNTVIVPVKTGAWGGFELQAFNGATGASMWKQSTDYTLPATGGSSGSYSWTPPYSPAISGNTLYYAGNGGTVYERGSLNSSGSVTPTQVPFYGSLSTYEADAAAYNADVAISTPITADSSGDLYFGFQATSGAPGGLTSGIARISSTGVGSFFEASSLMTGGSSAGMTQVITNSAPALSPNGSTVYVAMSNGTGSDGFGEGRLVALNAATLAPENSVLMMDPLTNSPATVLNDGTASPMVGPDGDVYMGVLDNENTSRGWMEHYSADLSVTKPTGGFGWDDTASIVPASMVPSYHGTSSYLIMTKYNNYAGTGGNGQNMLAILDPNATELDPRPNKPSAEGATIMQQVLTVLGPTPDPNHPGGVDEWCDNSAVVDPATDSILVNSEDGNMYRWNLLTNTLTQTVNITDGVGEAYTPTEIGPDGTVYGINNAKLWAIGANPGSGVFSTWSASGGGNWSDATNWSIAVPGNAGDTVTFDSSISGSSIVNLNGNESAGTINFYSSSSYTIAQGSSGTLTLNNGSSPAVINDLLGNHTISAPVYLASNTTLAVGQAGNVLTISGNISGPGGITLASTATTLSNGTVLLSGSNNYSGGTTVNGGKLVIGASGALPNGSVTITSGTLQLAMNTGAAQMTSLSITGGALDLTNNHINVADPGGLPDDSTFTTILSYVQSNAIMSTAGYSGYGIGVVDGNDHVSGASVAVNTIEVAYTLYGDANLDGKVDATDFGIFAPNFGATGFTLGWEGGDFNYDGMVDATDFGLFAPNFGLSDNGTDLSLPTADWAALDAFAAANGLLTNVPEPGTIGILALGFSSLMLRRRKDIQLHAGLQI